MNNNPITKTIIRPLLKADASYEVLARATYHPDFVKVYIPKVPYSKLKPNMEAIDHDRPSFASIQLESDLDRSLRRSKRTIKDYILSNRFEIFVTFTFKNNRYDINECKIRMSNWLKNQRKRKGKFEYLIVPEFHSDKKALHFHALLRGYNGEIVHGVNRGKILKDKYTIPSYKLGYNNVRIIDYSDNNSYLRLSNYVAKYITKDMPLFNGKNRFWASHSLKSPREEDNPKDWYKKAKPYKEMELDYGKLLYFYYKDILEVSYE